MPTVDALGGGQGGAWVPLLVWGHAAPYATNWKASFTWKPWHIYYWLLDIWTWKDCVYRYDIQSNWRYGFWIQIERGSDKKGSDKKVSQRTLRKLVNLEWLLINRDSDYSAKRISQLLVKDTCYDGVVSLYKVLPMVWSLWCNTILSSFSNSHTMPAKYAESRGQWS